MKAVPRRSTAVLYALSSLTAASLAFPAGALSQPESQSAGPTKFTKTMVLPWGVQSDSHNQSTFTLFKEDLETPAANSVDVTLSLSFDFAVSRGDLLEINATYAGGGDGDSQQFRPAALGLLSSPSGSRLTTTTITWSRKGLPAAGKRYEVQLSAAARDDDSDARAKAFGKRILVTIEMWPSE